MSDPLDFSAYEQMLNSRPPTVSNVRLRFFHDAIENKAKSAEAGRPIYDQVEMVSLINPGSRDELIKKVDDRIRSQYSSAYEHWRKTQQQPSDGTPLEMVPFLNVAQVRELRALNVESLEHLAGLSDMLKQRIGMGATELVRKAQAYLTAASNSAGGGKTVAENEELKRRVAFLEQSLLTANQRYEKLLSGVGPSAPAPATPADVVAPPAPPPVIDMQALVQAVAAALKSSSTTPQPADSEPEIISDANPPEMPQRRRRR